MTDLVGVEDVGRQAVAASVAGAAVSVDGDVGHDDREDQRQRLHRSQRGGVGQLGAGLDLVIRYAPVEFAQRHPQLHAGQVGSEAAVRTSAERAMPVRAAVEVHDLGIGELGRVGVGRAEQRADPFALADRASAHLDVLHGDPGDAGHRCLPAQ